MPDFDYFAAITEALWRYDALLDAAISSRFLSRRRYRFRCCFIELPMPLRLYVTLTNYFTLPIGVMS